MTVTLVPRYCNTQFPRSLGTQWIAFHKTMKILQTHIKVIQVNLHQIPSPLSIHYKQSFPLLTMDLGDLRGSVFLRELRDETFTGLDRQHMKQLIRVNIAKLKVLRYICCK